MMNRKGQAVLGIDAGSRTIKAVTISLPDNVVLSSGSVDQGVRQHQRASELIEKVVRDAGMELSDIAYSAATGYGRDHIKAADITFSEITCHTKGVTSLMPGARTVIDIGGQDSKLIKLDPRGSVHDFIMNDRCAAGTGRFLEVVAQRMEVPIEELDSLAAKATQPCMISSTCVVFAETEIVGLLAEETLPEDIAAGIFTAVAARIRAMAGQHIQGPVALTGGAALFKGLHTAIERNMGCRVSVMDSPRLTGALGAALLAREKLKALDI